MYTLPCAWLRVYGKEHKLYIFGPCPMPHNRFMQLWDKIPGMLTVVFINTYTHTHTRKLSKSYNGESNSLVMKRVCSELVQSLVVNHCHGNGADYDSGPHTATDQDEECVGIFLFIDILFREM